ncbi:hypothetical protein V6K52_15395 [Knoellia sp. S7-12]|uniref:HAAS signaling domain-containing protein n=1 Tax=Knoellia sp. S7-12 TaxID=3126698 RepID=UPI0033693A18
MSTSRLDYIRELSEQLRINGAPEAEVRDIVAQVEDHVAATGEDPVSAFGQPVDYARQWRPLSRRRWAGQVLLWTLPAAGVASGVTALLAEQRWGESVPLNGSDVARFVTIFCVVGLMPWTVGLFESRRRASRLGESTRLSPWPLRFAVIGVFAVVVGLLAWAMEAWGASSVLAEVPRWLLAVLGVVGLGAGFLTGPSPNSSGHAPAPPWAPREAWKTRVRRAFINR